MNVIKSHIKVEYVINIAKEFIHHVKEMSEKIVTVSQSVSATIWPPKRY